MTSRSFWTLSRDHTICRRSSIFPHKPVGHFVPAPGNYELTMGISGIVSCEFNAAPCNGYRKQKGLNGNFHWVLEWQFFLEKILLDKIRKNPLFFFPWMLKRRVLVEGAQRFVSLEGSRTLEDFEGADYSTRSTRPPELRNHVWELNDLGLMSIWQWQRKWQNKYHCTQGGLVVKMWVTCVWRGSCLRVGGDSFVHVVIGGCWFWI